eukprot:179176-Pyramimonas_sp.AAC.1
MHNTLWGRVWSHVREAHGQFVLFFERDGGGVSKSPAARSATIPDNTHTRYKMHLAATSGYCAATPRSLSRSFCQGRRGWWRMACCAQAHQTQ